MLTYHLLGLAAACVAGAGLALTLWSVWRLCRADAGLDIDHADYTRYGFIFSGIGVGYTTALLSAAGYIYSGRPMVWWSFLAFLLLPWAYIGYVGTLWARSDANLALGAATGVGNTGIVVPSALLLPIWGPVGLYMLA